LNSSIVAPCNELVDTWCRLTFQQTLYWFKLALMKAFSFIDLKVALTNCVSVHLLHSLVCQI
jgi:hypothetical protein